MKTYHWASFALLLLNSFLLSAQTEPKVVVNAGHTTSVYAIDFTPDEEYFVSSGSDGRVILWDVKTGLAVHNFSGLGSVYDIFVHTDGKFVIASSDIGLFNLSLEDYSTVWAHKPGGISANDMDIHPNGDRVVLAGNKKKIFEIKLKDGSIMTEFETEDGGNRSIAYNHDGSAIAIGHYDKLATVWNLKTKKKVNEVTGFKRAVDRVRFVGKTTTVLCRDTRKNLVEWDYQSGQQNLIDSNTSDWIANPDSNEILLLCSGWFYAMDANRNKEKHTYTKLGMKEMIRSSNGRYILTGSKTGELATWDANSFRNIKFYGGSTSMIREVGLSRDSRYMAMLKSSSTEVIIWDLLEGKQIEHHNVKPESVVVRPATYDVEFLKDERYMLLAVKNQIVLYDRRQREIVKLFLDGAEEAHDISVGTLSISPDEKYLASLGGDKLLKIWDLQSHRLIQKLDGQHGHGPGSLAWSSDGTVIAVGGLDKKVVLWKKVNGRFELDVNIGELSVSEQDKYTKGNLGYIMDLSFSDYGDQLYIASFHKGIWRYDLSKKKLNLLVSEEGAQTAFLVPAKDSSDKVLFTRNSNQKTLNLYELSSGELISSSPVERGAILSELVTTDNLHYLAGGGLGNILMYSTQELTKEATYLSMGRYDEYVSFLPNGYYRMSKGATDGVAFSFDQRSYPFEQFDLKYNRPDKVLSTLNSDNQELILSYRAAYHKRVKKMGFSPDQIESEIALPEISLSDLPDIISETKLIDIDVKASDSKYDLNRLNVYVNDVPIYGIRGRSLAGIGNTYNGNIRLELSQGKNKVQVSVHNNSGIESLKETFHVEYKGKTVKNDLYVVAVGVSNYMDKDFNLRYAAKDASDLIKTFEKADKYKKVHSIEVTNSNATRENIQAIKNKLLESKVDDEVILFVAGHGLVDDELDYYFATHDVDFYNPSARGLAYDDLEGLLDGIPARKKLMLIDACHSGEIDKDESVVTTSSGVTGSVNSRGFKTIEKKGGLGLANSFDLMKELFTDLRRGTGAMIISSASGMEFAYESKTWKNGVFTYSLLEALNTGNANQNDDEEIHVSELKDYVFKRVDELTAGQQHPTSRRENLENDFVVW